MSLDMHSNSLKSLNREILLLLSRFSRVRLCATPETAAHQAPLPLGFSRQEHWSGLPFPPPRHESEKWKWSCSVVSDSLRSYSLPGSSIHRIFQARVLEWGAIAFSIEKYKWYQIPNYFSSLWGFKDKHVHCFPPYKINMTKHKSINDSGTY